MKRLQANPQSKPDFYEFRPMIYVLVGLVGIAGKFLIPDVTMSRISLASGLLLFFAAWKVYNWRKEYRDKFR